jgi:micrococcal nuclease
MRRSIFLAALLGSILFPTLLLAADFTGRVVGISDGDTISLLHDGRAEKIWLNGIDCPEKRQAFGQRAKQFTSKLAFGKDVTVKVSGHDKYRRTIGEVILPDGRRLHQELVKTGPGVVV